MERRDFLKWAAIGGVSAVVPFSRSVSAHTGFINVTASPYGATGDGTTNDTAAIQAALTAALSSGRGLYFPTGIYLFDCSGAGLDCTADISIIGDGPDLTKIRVGPDPAPSNAQFIYCRPGVRLTVRGVHIEGPNDLGTGEGSGDGWYVTGIHHEGGGGSITVENVRITKVFQGLRSNATYGVPAAQYLRHSYIGGRGVQAQMNYADGEGYLEAIGCTFAQDADAPDWQRDSDASLYISAGASIYLDGCRFLHCTGYAVWMLGGVDAAKDSVVRGCYFDENCAKHIRISSGRRTILSGNTHKFGRVSSLNIDTSHGIVVNGDAVIEGCTFVVNNEAMVGAEAKAIDDHNYGDGEIYVKNCVFDKVAGKVYSWVRRATNPSGAKKQWKFEGCRFGDVSPAMAAPVYLYAAGGITDFDECVFTGTGAAVDAVAIKAGTVNVRDSRFVYQGPRVQSPSGNVELSVERCKFENYAGVRVVTATSGVVVNTRLADNTFATASYALITDVVDPAFLTGTLRLPPGEASYIYQTGTLSLYAQGDMFSINEPGSPTINALGFASVDQTFRAMLMVDGARVTLYAAQAFSLAHNTGSTGSGILTKSGSNLAVAAGSSATLRYSRSLRSWIEA